MATWVVLGSQAYENFNERRKIAIKALRTKQARDKRTSFQYCEDAFHDGKNVLSAVTEWHVYLRNSARRADTTTHRVLDLVDKHMLLPNPEERLMMGKLCEALDGILLLSDHEHQQNLEKGDLKEIGLETLNALQELDNQAPLRAAISQGPGSGVYMRKSGGYGGLLPIDDKPGRPSKTRKSERFDKIVLAKTANRVQNSQPMPEISESPVLLPEGADFGSANPIPGDGQQQEKIPDIRLDSGDSPSVEKPPPMRPPQEEPLDVQPYKTTSPESIPPGYSGAGSSRQLQSLEPDPTPLEHREKIVQSPPTASHQSLIATRPGILENPESAAAEAGASTSGRSDVRYPTHDRPEEEASGPSQILGHERSGQPSFLELQRNDPELRTTAIFLELADQNKNWDGQKKSWRIIKGAPQDQRLKRFISNRDVVRSASIPQPIFITREKKLIQIQVFVVDNAYSMLPHWDNLKTTLLALAMKVGSLDKDGLDLVYTCGDTNNVQGAKGWDIPKAFEQSIDRARSIMDQNDKTNIEETLSKCFDSHSATNMSPRRTLIVLTNGLWEGSKDWDSAEKEIARYVDTLRKNLRKREKRWFTIQFISFGQDQKALERLQELDDNLHGPEYVVIFFFSLL